MTPEQETYLRNSIERIEYKIKFIELALLAVQISLIFILIFI